MHGHLAIPISYSRQLKAFLLFLLFASVCTLGQTLHVYSIDDDRQTAGDYGYTLNGLRMISARSKLLNPVYFSPGGWYHKSIVIHDTFVASGSLAGISSVVKGSILFFGSFDVLNATTKPFTRAEKDSVYNWSHRGGKAIIAGHGLRYIGTDMGIMDSIYGYEVTTTSVGQELIYDPDAPDPGPFRGYFDNIEVVKQWGAAQGFFKKVPPRSVIYARDLAGRPTMFMDCNTLDLIVADVDVYSDLNLDITKGPDLWSKSDRLWGNSIAFMDSIPDPPVFRRSDSLLIVDQAFKSYQWYRDSVAIPGANSPTLNIAGSGSYFVEVPVYGGCLARSPIHITPKVEEPDPEPDQDTVVVVPAECNVFIPTAFSPNRNGLNESACVYGCFSSLEFRVFDRWGQLIFRGAANDACWDGMIDAKRAASPGTYAWTLKATTTVGEKISRSGYITLVR